ncbi:MAG: L-histidine N(alpha)-methyltransferase [Pseudomonadota bacterium]
MADGETMNAAADPAFLNDVLEGLAKPQKAVSSRWLYDQRGSELFEEITHLKEYYPTRTERSILATHAGDMAARIGQGAVVIEYGAGAAVKTRLLLDTLAPKAYAPLDISADFLREAASGLADDYPGIAIIPLVGNFLEPTDTSGLPAGPRCGFFPGSTIGNLTDGEIASFFEVARTTLGPDGQFLLGFDLKKDPAVLVPAYDDAQGVTAAFNLNLLTRINRELGGDFSLDRFRHEARWCDRESRIEMHIVSACDQSVTVAGRVFAFDEGETIHTEISRKFTIAALSKSLGATGWRVDATWQDPKGYFCMALLA